MKVFAPLILCLLPLGAFANTDDMPDCLALDAQDRPQAVVSACDALLPTVTGDASLHAAGLQARGVAYRALGDLTASARDLEASVAEFEDAAALRMLGWTYRQMGRYREAVDVYTQSLRLEDHWQAWLSRCVVRQDLGHDWRALRDCRKALQRTTDNTDVLYFTARALNEMRRPHEAKQLALEAMQLAPSDPRHVTQYVLALHLQGDARKASNVARLGLERFPAEKSFESFIQD
ncbi:tetratricopeptide repeat protein [Tropicibacter naphthalenivorans]|uniref:Poly-beta-1,6 N-acetyl-D-glucosamine export porin PgaA n=1 Tax=Tropicibacter naphthalenivorans TaxID=441103 RepID=A0A0P1G4P4_9RHOB|nr:tetratricopeptide repeat protein [Tropicibacter naphthalenivorans]CUH76702.1 poly-beta-1,6 N-acetyl-D-glucosamine export porin PgaA [Tropicibacter naphthalenivorans]SMC63660.1 TPR repeat-containing protein [Tropicibacter naphthalenivorans]